MILWLLRCLPASTKGSGGIAIDISIGCSIIMSMSIISDVVVVVGIIVVGIGIGIGIESQFNGLFEGINPIDGLIVGFTTYDEDASGCLYFKDAVLVKGSPFLH